MKNLTLFAFCISASLVLSACSQNAPAPQSTQTDTATNMQKKGDTIKTGKLIKIGAQFYIQEPGKSPAQIDSYVVNLSSYVDQSVKITGQYSGDTLFVGKVEQSSGGQ